MPLPSIRTVRALRGKRVLVRVDFNVPVVNGKVKDDYKIRASVPTIQFLLRQGATVILVSHLGRPTGVDLADSLAPVAARLKKILDRSVQFIPWHAFPEMEAEITKNKNARLFLLENIRFSPDEEKNTPALARTLAQLADIFVLDGFAVAHRRAASVSGVARYLPAYAGLLLEQEIKGLTMAAKKHRGKTVLVLGGIKTETKIPVLRHLLQSVDVVLIGGGVANTYLASCGYAMGASVVDKNALGEIKKYARNKKIITPIDVVVGNTEGTKIFVVPVTQSFAIENNKNGVYDIGPETIKVYNECIAAAKVIIWNGAMGHFEIKKHQTGTVATAEAIAKQSRAGAFTVVGGGETVEVVRNLKLAKSFGLVSTGGGAMLEFLAGKKLPGIEALSRVLKNNN